MLYEAIYEVECGNDKGKAKLLFKKSNVDIKKTQSLTFETVT